MRNGKTVQVNDEDLFKNLLYVKFLNIPEPLLLIRC